METENAIRNDYCELVEKLSDIQSKIALGKDLKNSYKLKSGGTMSFSYRNAEQILQAVKPLLNGAAILCSDDIELIDNVWFCRSSAKFIYKNAHIETYGFAQLDYTHNMSKEQVIGCASSYARKYALQGLLAISDGSQDPDGLQPEKEPDNRQTEKQDDKASRVYNKALSNLKDCKDLSAMLIKKADMVSKMPEFKSEINKAYDTAVAELDALNDENQAAANSHNDDDCPF